jgi:hypothetical protein
LSNCDVAGISASLHLSEWAHDDHVHFCDQQVKPTIDSDPTAFAISDLKLFGDSRRRMP